MLMGGAKKLNIAQAEKQQAMRNDKETPDKKSQKQKTTEKKFEKKLGSVEFPKIAEKDLISEFEKMKAVTPYAVASKYNLRISIAKDLLADLMSKNIVQFVAGDGNLKIYKVSASTQA